MHANQLTVTVDVVRDLVAQQFPQWRGLPVRPVASEGTVNRLFRVGERVAARFPLERRDPAATRALLEAEARAARELLGRTRFPTPEPLGLGEPTARYPSPWSVQTWLSGTVATADDPGASVDFARDLAELIRDIRAIDTRGRTFDGWGRGGELRAHDAWMATSFARSERLLDVLRLRAVWGELREVPRDGAPDVMTHGDLIPGNVLVERGRLAGVIDVGGLGPADPALDLVAAWHLLDSGPRRVLRDELECDDLEWARGAAWAFEQAMGLVWYYVDSNPAMSRLGRRTLQRITQATVTRSSAAEATPPPRLRRAD
jgi:aminoglycoside phosphotransferase (APT) family kinase protein